MNEMARKNNKRDNAAFYMRTAGPMKTNKTNRKSIRREGKRQCREEN